MVSVSGLLRKGERFVVLFRIIISPWFKATEKLQVVNKKINQKCRQWYPTSIMTHVMYGSYMTTCICFGSIVLIPVRRDKMSDVLFGVIICLCLKATKSLQVGDFVKV